MALQASITTDLRYCREATFGTTPATPSMRSLNRVSSSLNLTKDSYQSARLRQDRKIKYLRHGTRRVEGELQDELSLISHDDLLAGALQGDWSGDVLKDGVTHVSFTMEEVFPEISGTNKYRVFTGVTVNTAQISLPATGLATVSYGLIGRNMESKATALDASTDSPLGGSLLQAVNGQLTFNGAPVAFVTGLEIGIENNISGDPVVGSNFVPKLFLGRCVVKGSFTAYVDSLDVLTAFENEEELAISLTLNGDEPGTSLKVEMPRVKLSAATTQTTGEGGIIVSAEYQALLDDVEGCQIKITRDNA